MSSLSVLIATYNAARYLPAAIASVRGQTRPADEIVVVDDGSSDGTAAVVAGLGSDIRYAWQENAGPAAARNTAMRLASGDLLAFVDADDELLPRHLEVLAELLERPGSDELAAVLGQARLLRELQDGTREEGETTIHFGSILSRRSTWERVGELDESLRIGEDVDWLLRIREHGLRIGVAGEATLLYRRHRENLTSDEAETRRAFLHMLARSTKRRAAQNGRELASVELPGEARLAGRRPGDRSPR